MTELRTQFLAVLVLTIFFGLMWRTRARDNGEIGGYGYVWDYLSPFATIMCFLLTVAAAIRWVADVLR